MHGDREDGDADAQLLAQGIWGKLSRAVQHRMATLVTERVHPKGLDFVNQHKVVLHRDIHKQSWEEIREEEGERCLHSCFFFCAVLFNSGTPPFR